MKAELCFSPPSRPDVSAADSGELLSFSRDKRIKCEIEFLAVGDASCAGDAIIVRYGDESAFELMLVDGGHAATGDRIVSHIHNYFGPYAGFENVVLTHSDADHASGLRTVLKEMPVKNLWLHIPWLLADPTLFKGGWSDDGLRQAIKKEYDIIAEIVDLALEQGCNLYYPFAGDQIGPFVVCSPTLYAYQHLLPQFDKTPDPNQGLIEERRMWLGKESILRRMFDSARTAVAGWTAESWHIERLRDGGRTSASNETSVILFGQFQLGNAILTGDAGVEALTWAADYLEGAGLPLRQFRFVQVPHHGSRRNVGPTILNRLIGSSVPETREPFLTAFVSAPADDSNHPRRIVTNAFLRRGASVIATQGQDKIHYGGFSTRPGYVAVTAMPFYDIVEEYS